MLEVFSRGTFSAAAESLGTRLPVVEREVSGQGRAINASKCFESAAETRTQKPSNPGPSMISLAIFSCAIVHIPAPELSHVIRCGWSLQKHFSKKSLGLRDLSSVAARLRIRRPVQKERRGPDRRIVVKRYARHSFISRPPRGGSNRAL